MNNGISIDWAAIKEPKDYMRLYKDRKLFEGAPHRLRVAILASGTVNGLKEILSVECLKLGVNAEIFVAGYNQYAQEIINPASELYKFNPELAILFVNVRAILGDSLLIPNAIGDNERRKNILNAFATQISQVNELKKNFSGNIIIHNLEVPVYSPYGILENKQPFGIAEGTELFNSKLRDEFKKDDRVFVFDYNAFSAKVGKSKIFDHTLYYLADINVDFNYFPDLCREYLKYIRALTFKTKKCLVLDLDNVLWGGVIGEDGIDRVRLGPTPEGRSFWEFQKFILSLYHRGIILAVNSHNNSDEALKMLREHPEMILKEKHFSSLQIDWRDKVEKMKAIKEELNIGYESLVFIDDDKMNREMIKKALPQVSVLELPDDPSLYLKTLQEADYFETLGITDEDLGKGGQYAAERERLSVKDNFLNIDDYLRELNTVAAVAPASPLTIPRIAQLTQKTNQFNLTARRYRESEIKSMLENNFCVFSLRAADKFGDYGLIGAAIASLGKRCVIDSFLLSCRVIGKRLEDVFISHLINFLIAQGADEITGEFIPTAKNSIVRNFYADRNFEPIKKDESTEVWRYNFKKPVSIPDYIKIID